MNTHPQHLPAPILVLQQADMVGLHPEHPTMREKNLRAELATAAQPFGDIRTSWAWW